MLRVEHLTKTYPNGSQALKDVSFTVEDGQFLAVIGLSGSGKSTLLRCINRLIEPTSGKIIWNDIDVTAAPASQLRVIRRQIGMIFQHFNLVKRSSVLTNVLSGRLGYINPMQSLVNYFSPADQQRALKNLDRLGLADKAYVRADSLSGGQQQRVGIARALAMSPDIILFDEATSALDPGASKEVFEVIDRLASEEGSTMVLVTHDMQFAFGTVPDEVIFMKSGVIHRRATPQEMKEDPEVRQFAGR